MRSPDHATVYSHKQNLPVSSQTPLFIAPPTTLFVTSKRLALGLSVLSGLLYFLGFAAFEVHPFAFISFTPLLIVLRGRRGFTALRYGWLMGTVAMAGGFYWIVEMLGTFSGFPLPLCVLFASLLWIAQGLLFGVFSLAITRLDDHHIPRLVSVPLSLAAVEMLFPVLFPWYTANSLHNLPVLIQTADLGGVLFVSAALGLGHAALDEVICLRAPWRQRLAPLAVPLGFWALAIPYGLWRIHQIDTASRTLPALRVGIVQQNLGLMQKRDDPYLALERHLTASRALEAQGVDLLVWSESALAFRLPEGLRNITEAIPPWDLHTPTLFGALSVRGQDSSGRPRLYNTAFMTDAHGDLRGHYDKVYLLAFGEYIPLGDIFPSLYDLSRNSGHFTRGSTFNALPVPGGTVAPLICYEDILPRFVRDFQRRADPDLLAVILNDAWFGNTAEPWIHNALARFRAVEQRRDLVRAANSGVSSIIDAAGRHIAHGQTFRVENVVGTVHLRKGHTVYYYLGDWIGWAGVALILSTLRRKRSPKNIVETTDNSYPHTV